MSRVSEPIWKLRPNSQIVCLFTLLTFSIYGSIAESDPNSKAEIVARLSQPWMVPYKPGDDVEAQALDAFRKDIYPRDVVAELSGGGVGIPIRWTGIIVERRTIPMLGGTAAELIIEHHYWDWRETTNDELIYISQRGEGRFRCFFAPYEIEVLGGHQVGDFVIVYGIPWMIRQTDGLIGVECLKTRFISSSVYTIEAWSYGREFVEKGDIEDVQVLSTE